MEQVNVAQQICHNLGITTADLDRQRASDGTVLHTMQSAKGTGRIGRCIDAMRRAVDAADGDDGIFTACLTDARSAIDAVLSIASENGGDDTVLMVRGSNRPLLRIPSRR
jgi:hypothetical protein